jgi:peptide/nickel transport system ATP-binding protein
VDVKAAPLLSVRDLVVRFAGRPPTTAIAGVSFDLAAGEVLGLLGESGSGKSVTLRTLLRLHRPATTRVDGAIRVDGADVLTMDDRSLRRYRGGVVSMVFQEPGMAFDPVCTIGDQIVE